MQKLNPSKLKENIRKIARYDLDENNVFGSSYLVSQCGEIVYRENFGYRDANSKYPVTDDTIYRLASMTKPVTAVAILILCDRGIINLYDNVKKYFPEFEGIHIIDEQGNDIGKPKHELKVHHLLSHTSGFGGVFPIEQTKEDKKTVDSWVNYFMKKGLAYDPATKQAYSATAAFDLLVKIAMKVTGEDFEAFLKREVFAPCGMKDTTFMPNDEQWSRIISMHDNKDGKNINADMIQGCVFGDFPATHMLGGAGLISTMDDYYKFTLMLLNCGDTPNGRILSKEMFDNLYTPWVDQSLMGDRPHTWGLGVRVITKPHYRLPVGSYGWSGAYGAHFWIDPVNEVTAVFMKNSKIDGGAGNNSANRFEEAVFNAFELGV